jgi:hypothetical protein
MKPLHLFLSLAILLFASCKNNKEERLDKVWIYDENLSGMDLRKEGIEGAKVDYDLTPANFISLRPDGTFSACLPDFKEGSWKQKGRDLVLNAPADMQVLRIIKQENNTLLLVDLKKQLVHRFIGADQVIASREADPFSSQNNQWRKRATRKENDAELQARLKNHFHFWEAYFNWGLQSKMETLDVRSTPSLFKLYGNGFQLEYFEYLPEKWMNLFYDTADCRRAYEMVYYKMYEKDVNWGKTDNRFEMLASAFKQVQGWMEEPVSKYVGQKQ